MHLALNLHQPEVNRAAHAACAAATRSPPCLRRASLHVYCGTTPAWAARAARATAARSAARRPRRRGRCAAACEWPPLPADPRPPTTWGRCTLRSRAHLTMQRTMSELSRMPYKRLSTASLREGIRSRCMRVRARCISGCKHEKLASTANSLPNFAHIATFARTCSAGAGTGRHDGCSLADELEGRLCAEATRLVWMHLLRQAPELAPDHSLNCSLFQAQHLHKDKARLPRQDAGQGPFKPVLGRLPHSSVQSAHLRTLLLDTARS